MKHKKQIIFFISLLSILILIPNAQALSISPAKVEILFVPNAEHTITLTVANGHNTDVEPYKEGPLAHLVTFEEKKTFLTTRGQFTVDAKIKLPEYLEPGPHSINIGVRQVPKKEYGRPAITAIVAVSPKVTIWVPYPEKYLEASLSATNPKLGEIAYFTAKIISRGEQDIASVSGNIEIYDSLGNKKAVVPLTTASDLSTGANTELYAELATTNLNPGSYKAIAKINYDGKYIEASTYFNIGSLDIEILNITTVTREDLAKFEILVKSKWNDDIEDVYADIELISLENGRTLATLKTPSITLKGFKTGTLTALWDAAGQDPGNYEARVTVYYGDKTTTRTIQYELEDKTLEFSLVGMVVVAIALIIMFSFYFVMRSGRLTINPSPRRKKRK